MLNEIRLKIVDFMSKIIIENKIFSLNLWDIIHFFSGAILMIIILYFFKKRKGKAIFLLLFVLLLGWELFEFGIREGIPGFFRGESVINIFWDLVVGMFGGFLAFKFRKKLIAFPH